jgi:RNA polymerase sigma-70 factor, ECF subfamily
MLRPSGIFSATQAFTACQHKKRKIFWKRVRFRWFPGLYQCEGKSVSDDWRTIGLGGTADQFLGEVIDRYRKLMFRVARGVTRNDDDADDAVQKVCVRFVINGIPAGLRENPPAYLIGCIKNEAKNVHRARERRRIEENVDLGKFSAPAGGTTEKAVLDALEEAKACLSSEELDVVELYYTHGFAQADIAEMKAMEESTVAQKLSRSRKKIRKAMEGEGRIHL